MDYVYPREVCVAYLRCRGAKRNKHKLHISHLESQRNKTDIEANNVDMESWQIGSELLALCDQLYH